MTMRIATDFGAFEVTSLPGQPQIAVCHSFFISEDYRGAGHGGTLKIAQMAALRELHYDQAIATVSAGNARQLRIIERLGWKKLTEFRNRRNSETTYLYGLQMMGGDDADC